jgi:hypothetical protein
MLTADWKMLPADWQIVDRRPTNGDVSRMVSTAYWQISTADWQMLAVSQLTNADSILKHVWNKHVCSRLTNVDSRLTNVVNGLTNIGSRLTNIDIILTSVDSRTIVDSRPRNFGSLLLVVTTEWRHYCVEYSTDTQSILQYLQLLSVLYTIKPIVIPLGELFLYFGGWILTCSQVFQTCYKFSCKLFRAWCEKNPIIHL